MVFDGERYEMLTLHLHTGIAGTTLDDSDEEEDE